MKKKNLSKENILLSLIVVQAIILIAIFVYSIIVDSSVISVNPIIPQNGNVEILNAKITLLEKHECWTISILGISFAITAILFGLIQWYLSQKAETKINDKLSNATTKIFKDLTARWNMDKNAFIKAIDIKVVELELMSEYPIFIISDDRTEKGNSAKLYNLLQDFHFERIKRISYNEAYNKKKFCDKSVIVFCDKADDSKSKDEDLIKKLLPENPKLGVFGFENIYGEEFKSQFRHYGCISFAQFPSQIYNNIMSLLHYKRYLNKNNYQK